MQEKKWPLTGASAILAFCVLWGIEGWPFWPAIIGGVAVATLLYRGFFIPEEPSDEEEG